MLSLASMACLDTFLCFVAWFCCIGTAWRGLSELMFCSFFSPGKAKVLVDHVI